MKKLTICGTGIARFAIVTKPVPAPAEKTAAEFLQRVIETSCGVKLPISTNAEHGIYIGTRPDCAEIKWDGFRMTTDDRNLYLDGNIPRGTLYAAYDFAEKYLGYRLFASDRKVGNDCEVISTDGEAEVPAGLNMIDNPAFEVRRTTCRQHLQSNLLSAFARLNDCMPCGEELGGGVGLTGGCHSFGYLCPGGVYFDEHPEYYSLVDGKRIPCNDAVGPGQLCLTNPDVIRIVSENILNQLRAAPHTRVIEISQADNQNYCRCENCAAVDEEEGSPSGTMIRFVNAVAEQVTKEFPNVLFRTFAYQYTRKPPKKVKAHPNVLVRYCTIEACFRHGLGDPDCERNSGTFGPELREWQKIAKQVSIWDYITNWACFIPPYPNLASLRENARFFAENNAIHVLEECNPYGNEGGVYPELKAYLCGKLLWNPYMSEEEYNRHINEFLCGYYGKGWENIRRYLDMELEETAGRCFTCWEEVDLGFLGYASDPQVPGIQRFIRKNYNPNVYQPVVPDHALTRLGARVGEIQSLFDKALELAETDVEREHIQRSRISIDFMELFLTPHLKNTMSPEECAAHEAAVKKFHENKVKYQLHLNNDTAGDGR